MKPNLPMFPSPKTDDRLRNGGWCPPREPMSGYWCTCHDCKEAFIGAKRSYQCADCAYAAAARAAVAMGARVRERREAAGLTMDQLAASTGNSKSYVWELENGRAENPGAELLRDIAIKLGVTLEYLIGRCDLEAAQDQAFFRTYMMLTPALRAKVRAIADIL